MMFSSPKSHLITVLVLNKHTLNDKSKSKWICFLLRSFRKHMCFSIKTKVLDISKISQNPYHSLPQKQTSAPDCTFTKRRQLREVSTPNRDVWRGAALSGTNQRRCVKTERRRRAVADRFGRCCEGVIRGISQKIPLIRTQTP